MQDVFWLQEHFFIEREEENGDYLEKEAILPYSCRIDVSEKSLYLEINLADYGR